MRSTSFITKSKLLCRCGRFSAPSVWRADLFVGSVSSKSSPWNRTCPFVGLFLTCRGLNRSATWILVSMKLFIYGENQLAACTTEMPIFRLNWDFFFEADLGSFLCVLCAGTRTFNCAYQSVRYAVPPVSGVRSFTLVKCYSLFVQFDEFSQCHKCHTSSLLFSLISFASVFFCNFLSLNCTSEKSSAVESGIRYPTVQTVHGTDRFVSKTVVCKKFNTTTIIGNVQLLAWLSVLISWLSASFHGTDLLEAGNRTYTDF